MSDEKRYYMTNNDRIIEYPASKCHCPQYSVSEIYSEKKITELLPRLGASIAEAAIAHWAQQREEHETQPVPEPTPEPCHECEQLRQRIDRQVAHINDLQEALSRKNQKIRMMESGESLRKEIEQTEPNTMTPRLQIASEQLAALIVNTNSYNEDYIAIASCYADALLTADRKKQ